MFTFLAMTWSVNKLQYKQSKRKCESCPVSCNQSPTYTKVLLTIYNNCLQNFSHSLHQQRYIDNMNKQFDCLIRRL